MADRYGVPVLFTLEKGVYLLSAHITFGANGVPTLDTQNSKGFCNVSLNQIPFTATSANTSTSLTTVSSYVGLYPGMTVQDSGPTHVNSTISAMTPGSDTITLAAAATGTNTGLTAFGGQYVLQFGVQAGVRLDTYVKLLSLSHNWDESGSQGSATTAAIAPAAPSMFLVGNKISVRTIPQVGSSNLTDATLTIQFGSGSGSSFVAANPASGEGVRISVMLGTSTAV